MSTDPNAPVVVRLTRLSRCSGLAGLIAFLAVGLFTGHYDRQVNLLAGTLIALAGGVPLFLARERFLLLYAAGSTAGVLLINANAGGVGWFAVCVIGAWCALAVGIRAGAVYWTAGVLAFGAEWLVQPDSGWIAWIAGISFSVGAGSLIRHQLVLVERLHAAQADLAERSRAQERGRIAGELHDVIAHSLTVSLLHVSSARLAVEHEDPAEAVRALVEAERLGRQSLAEVRATMGLPRAAGDPDGAITAPIPGIGDLQTLIDQVRAAGVDVTLALDGDLAAAPATTGSTVYRIVQEALTNATKHAPGSPVRVRAAARSGRLEVLVDSAGRPGHGSGMGLPGMRDRAEAVGGACTAGPGGSGWLVHATLPLGPGQGVDAT